MRETKNIQSKNVRRVIVPFFSEIHGRLLAAALQSADKKWVVLTDRTSEVVEKGLSAVNNDACYEAFSSVGQLLSEATLSKGDIVAVPQVCLKCRSTDLPAIVEFAFEEKGFPNIQVLDLDLLLNNHTLDNLGVGVGVQKRCAQALVLGDVLLQVRSMLFPGEERMNCFAKMMRTAEDFLKADMRVAFASLLASLCDELPDEVAMKDRPEIVITGTAPLVFDENMNSQLMRTIEKEGCRVRLPYLSDYVRFALREKEISCIFLHEIDRVLEDVTKVACLPVKPEDVSVLRSYVDSVIPQELTFGTGWLLAARIAQYVDQGTSNIVFANSFGCLSGHVMGKGVLKWARSLGNEVNIASIEFDPGTSAVNQVNRVKLLTTIAKRKHQKVGASSKSGLLPPGTKAHFTEGTSDH